MEVIIYPSGRVVADEMTDALDEYIGPVALLVDDSGEVSVDVPPWSIRSTRESLDAAEGRILQEW